MIIGVDMTSFSQTLLWLYGTYPYSLVIIAFAFVVAFGIGATVIFARGFRL